MPHITPRIPKNDRAISPVIGTILMVAATVIIAGAVYAAINAYSGRNSKPPLDAGWKAQAVDTNGNGVEDAIKITYLSGPDNANVTITIADASGHSPTMLGSAPAWNAGAFEIYQKGSIPVGATVYITVVQGGTTVLDQTLAFRE